MVHNETNNGFGATTTSSVASNITTCLDPKQATNYLKEYSSPDGLSADEIMNSNVNGGLTYNDFLIFFFI